MTNLNAVDTREGASAKRIYSLLFLDEHHNNNRDLAAGSAIALYVGCASLAACSARKVGLELTILTNKREQLLEVARQAGVPEFSVQEISFELNIPKGIRYFQAHYKISALKSFSTGEFGTHPTLVDSDIFIHHDFLHKVIDHQLVAYDVSHKAAAHLIHDVSIMMPLMPKHRQWWAGGEFISGTPAAFGELSRTIDALLPRYIEKIASFIHVSDETPVSAALNQLSSQGFAIAEAGQQLGIIGRWHSSRTVIPQETLTDLWSRDVLHVPADKKFLASLAPVCPDANQFFATYTQYARKKILSRSLFNPVLNMIKGKKTVPVI